VSKKPPRFADILNEVEAGARRTGASRWLTGRKLVVEMDASFARQIQKFVPRREI
jgi:hypothetical protein